MTIQTCNPMRGVEITDNTDQECLEALQLASVILFHQTHYTVFEETVSGHGCVSDCGMSSQLTITLSSMYFILNYGYVSPALQTCATLCLCQRQHGHYVRNLS